jgi:hypothetical protein
MDCGDPGGGVGVELRTEVSVFSRYNEEEIA